MQSSVPKRKTVKCLLTVGTDVKNVMEGRGTEGRGMEGRGMEGRGTEGRGTEGNGGEWREGGDQARFFMWIK